MFEGFEIRRSGELMIVILFLVIFTSSAFELAVFGLLPEPIAIAAMAVACTGVAMAVWTPRWRGSVL
jgi:hypothetical protein